jgi:hypothetical protein
MREKIRPHENEAGSKQARQAARVGVINQPGPSHVIELGSQLRMQLSRQQRSSKLPWVPFPF